MVVHIFVRHAHTEPNPDDPALAWKLSAKGKLQSETLVSEIQALGIDIARLYSSAEKKAHDTLIPLSNNLKLPITKVTQFGEMHFTHYIESEEEFVNLRKQQFLDPDGHYAAEETANVALYRFQQAIDNLPEENSVISAHGTILSLYFGHLLRLDGSQIYEAWTKLHFTAIGIVENGQAVSSIFDK